MENIECGIVGFGFAFPEGTRDATEISRLSGVPEAVVRDKFGINKVYWPDKEEQTSDLAVAAALDCLKNTGVDPLEIDMVLYFGENHSDYQIYSVGPRVQGAIGAKNAWAYDMEAKCGSCVVALDQAKKYMQTEEGVNTVMLVAGYRNVDVIDYTDQTVTFLYDISCGGAACIVKKGYARRNFLSFAGMSDGRFSDMLLLPNGGTKNPWTKDNIDDDYGRYYRLVDPDLFRSDLAVVTVDNLINMQVKALAKIGKTLEDLDFAVNLHMNVKNHAAVIGRLGLPLEKSFYLCDYGHVGQLDVLIALDQAEKRGLIKEGDLIGLAGMGMGYTWVGGIMRW
ncbi:3-oxoacyl-[acyl-carrier-protein] synthase 3 [Clostridia bacterium]|nr:3-oxoacyl-[acyl-carrier-protein] synthase 3 [Clostridia bacterium]